MRGVAAARGPLQVVQAAEHPVEIPPFLVVDIGLLGALSSQVLAASVIFTASWRASGAARRSVLAIGGGLLRHALCADLLPAGTADNDRPEGKHEGQDQGISHHALCC